MAMTLQKIIESHAMQEVLCQKLGVEEIDAEIHTQLIENTNLLKKPAWPTIPLETR